MIAGTRLHPHDPPHLTPSARDPYNHHPSYRSNPEDPQRAVSHPADGPLRAPSRSYGRMTRRYVNQLSNGDAVDEAFLVTDKQLRANRQGNLYLQLELRDKSGSVGARLWNATENLARSFEPGDYLHVRGKTQVFQGALQIILSHVEVVDPSRVEPDDFLPRSSQNVARLTERLREVLLGLTNPHLRALVECFLIDDEFLRKFTTAPA